MVTISKANLSEAVPEALRDILRNNLTNPTTNTAQWIFKDNPQIDFDQNDYPVVIIEEASIEYETLGFKGSRYIPKEINLNINVYTQNQYHRDVISDDIREILFDSTKADANGDTLHLFALRLKSIRTSSRDIFIDQPKMLRVKEIALTLTYFGG